MPFTVVAAGPTLQILNPDGSVLSLGLPAGITIDPMKPARFAILGKFVVCVNAPSAPVAIHAAGEDIGTVTTLVLRGPTSAPTLAPGPAAALIGTFNARVAFVKKDSTGGDLQISELGPASNDVTVASQAILVSNIPISGDPTVTARRVYRTTNGPGSEYFAWFDLDDNTTTTYTDGMLDEELPTVPVDPLDFGSAPPGLVLICEWKGRLWGKDAANVDHLRYTTDGHHDAWPATNFFPVRPVGRDHLGITGLIPRRDELGVGKRDIIWKVIGSNEDDFRMVKVIEGKGILAPDSVNVVRDVARFLSDDGVYQWNNEGVSSITDAKAHPWFSTDDFFNRDLFSQAFGRYSPIRHAYDLFLAAAGSTVIDRWVSFDIAQQNWLGPHKTDAFAPTCAGVLFDEREVLIPAIGGADANVYLVTPGVYRDGASTPIAYDVIGKFHSGQAPDIHHYWGELSMLTKIEPAGTLVITPKVGRLDAPAQPPIAHDLTMGRQRLRRLAVGPLCQLRLQNAELNQAVEIYGYEVPFHEVGRR